jgi:hypothetical protein
MNILSAVQLSLPVRTAHTYGPYVRPERAVRTGSVAGDQYVRPERTARTYG